jgi:hypothetical protein
MMLDGDAVSSGRGQMGRGIRLNPTTDKNFMESLFELVQQSKKFVPGSLIGVKDSDFVGRPEAETP